MPIRFNKDFYEEFSKLDQFKFRKYIRLSADFTLINLILSIVIYFAATYLGFVYWGPEGYYFDYIARLNVIQFCYYLSWVSIIIAAFGLFFRIYLKLFTVNPYAAILKARKDEDKQKIEKELDYFNKMNLNRIGFQGFFIAVSLFSINYYPRNTELFFPYISCNADTGICVIDGIVLYPFLVIMTGVLIISLCLCLIILLINYREYIVLKDVITPDLEKHKQEKKQMTEQQKRKEWRMLEIEEKRKRKLEEIRRAKEEKIEQKVNKRNALFEKMLKEEKIGNERLKDLKKREKERIKKRDNKFDFR